MDCELHFVLNCSYAKKSVIEWHRPCGSFTVESESIGMGNMRIVQKVVLSIGLQ